LGEKFVVQGGYPLAGRVVPAGNKNAALPILAACLLTDQEIVLRNVPVIRDVENMLAILSDLGVEVRWSGDHELTVRAVNVRKAALDPGLCRQIRASILLAGPMLARCGDIELPPPGGDVIGRRRVDTHLLALRALGADIRVGRGYRMKAKGHLRAAEILLDETSVTATENAMMAAALAKGTTVIHNAASEPHVQDLAHFLNSLGAKISGAGTSSLVIQGVEKLSGGSHEVVVDHTEIASFIALAAVTGSTITIANTVPEHLRMILLAFRRLGIKAEVCGNDIFVPRHERLKIVSDAHGAIPKIDDAPWPGFPTDLISIAIVVATQAQGTILIFEKMFEGRMFFVDKLIAMGARIVLCDPYRVVVVGPSRLRGEIMESPDIRAGMALLIASLCAEGTSVIGNIGQIDRGYERIEERLQALGAHIERVKE